MRQYIRFEWQIVQASILESWEFFRAHIVPEVALATVFGAAALLRDFFTGSGNLTNSIAWGVATGTLGCVVIFLVVLTAKIFTAPYRMYQTEKAKVLETHAENAKLVEGLKPKININFGPVDPWVKKFDRSIIVTNHENSYNRETVSISHTTESWFFRVCVQNARQLIVHKCRTLITNIEYSPNGSDFQNTSFGNSQPLRWTETDQAEFEPRDIAPKQKCYVDVLSVDPIYQKILIKWPGDWIANEDLFSGHGTYRLTVCVSSEDGGHTGIILLVRWNGVWNQIQMHVEESK